jgi:enamine deaminase RidA (YjgF/YER057c/UK114 family)
VSPAGQRQNVHLAGQTPLLHLTPGVRVGPYLFVSGQLGTDWRTTPATSPVLPHLGDPTRAEVKLAFQNLELVVTAAGMTLDDVARVDNYYGHRDVSTGHFAARDEVFPMNAMLRPASTAMQTDGFPADGCTYAIEAIAVQGGREGIITDDVPASPGRLPQAIRAGDFVFLSGRIASDYKTGLAPEAKTTDWIWIGSPIHAQTEYLLRTLETILRAAGCSLRDVVKAEVFLCDPRDITGLDEVWRVAFPQNPPARSIFIVDGLAMPDTVVEINFVALDPGSQLSRRTIQTAAAPEPLFYEPQAVRAGPLVFLSTQLAHDDRGLAERARPRPGFSNIGAPGRLEAELILGNVAAICEAAEGSLSDVVKVQTHLSDLGQLDAVNEAWKRAFPADPPAWTVVSMTAPRPVAGARVMCDVIACLPTGEPAAKED